MFNPSIKRSLDKLLGQYGAQTTSLPTIFGNSCILGPVTFRYSDEAYNGNYLVWLSGIQRNQCEVVHAIYIGEVPGLLGPQLFHRKEEA